MQLFEKCKKLIEFGAITENETEILLSENRQYEVTFPPNIISTQSYDVKWLCKHVYYISDIHLVHKILKQFSNNATDLQVEKYIKGIAKELFTKSIKEEILACEETIFLFGGDISSDFDVSRIFYNEFMKELGKQIEKSNNYECYVYAILGNHELWGFDSVNDCCEAYEELFSSLNIEFLNNSVTLFGNYKVPMKSITDKKSKEIKYVMLDKEKNKEEYEYQKRFMHNALIIGGIGFAGYNTRFNADAGIYRGVLSREKEIEETNNWEKFYNNVLQYATEEKLSLIVLTHNPLCDWKEDKKGDSNCIYFNGHSHKNHLYHDDERNIHIFANNQIGYYSSIIQFKAAYIYKRMNPFAVYPDGYHEIKTEDYLRFYDFMRDKIEGNGLVEKQIKNQDAHFYMIKHNGFYGFFLVSAKGTYICAGGRIKKISKCTDIKYFDKDFLCMTRNYIKILFPYRNALEQISESVKSFGGDGTIHGCIVDIDFCNHIMLNPIDGCITYYYSPDFGKIEKHESLLSLLNKHNKLLANRYRKKIGSKGLDIVKQEKLDSNDNMMEIDIKNSLYSVSNKMNQLQRLFDKKILRDWNEALLFDENTLINSH